MPNLYVTPYQIKQGLTDALPIAQDRYDPLLARIANDISRLADRECGRTCYPYQAVRRYSGNGSGKLWIDDLISLTSIEFSEDEGLTYQAYQAGDYLLTVAGDPDDPQSYNLIMSRKWATTVHYGFPRGQAAVKIAGVWGYHQERAGVWEASGDDVQDVAGITAQAGDIAVSDAAGLDPWGLEPKFQAGQLARIGDEFIEIVGVDQTQNKIKVIRGRNGTTAAAHDQGAGIDIFKPSPEIQRACLIQVTRHLERSMQGFADARATPEIAGSFKWTKAFDPEALEFIRKAIRFSV